MDETYQPKPVRAIRLIFEYEGDQVRLVSQQPVEMAITVFDVTQAGRPGYYIDICDATGRTLARVPARNAFSGSMEIFPENHSQPITRIDVAKPHGAFTVVVPASADADHASVVKVMPGKPDSLDPKKVRTQVINLARFPLKSNTEGGGRP